MLDGSRALADDSERDFHALDREMRQVLPERGPLKSPEHQRLRRKHLEHLEKPLRMHPRPTRVS